MRWEPAPPAPKSTANVVARLVPAGEPDPSALPSPDTLYLYGNGAPPSPVTLGELVRSEPVPLPRPPPGALVVVQGLWGVSRGNSGAVTRRYQQVQLWFTPSDTGGYSVGGSGVVADGSGEATLVSLSGTCVAADPPGNFEDFALALSMHTHSTFRVASRPDTPSPRPQKEKQKKRKKRRNRGRRRRHRGEYRGRLTGGAAERGAEGPSTPAQQETVEAAVAAEACQPVAAAPAPPQGGPPAHVAVDGEAQRARGRREPVPAGADGGRPGCALSGVQRPVNRGHGGGRQPAENRATGVRRDPGARHPAVPGSAGAPATLRPPHASREPRYRTTASLRPEARAAEGYLIATCSW